jgi:hypothetical protein
MAQLGSPGVQVNVIDESFYNPAQPGTVPLILFATAQDKTNAAGTGVASGTLAANAGTLYLVTSQKDLTDRFGTPVFQKDSSGNAIQGSELSEYGLFSTYSFLGASNSAYVLRANVDLNALESRASAPVGSPDNGTYWLDSAKTRFGAFEWNEATQDFTVVEVAVLNSTTDVVDYEGEDYTPKTSVGAVGDYAVVTLNIDNVLWYKNSDGKWVVVGSNNMDNTPYSTDINWSATDWVSSYPAVSTGSLVDYAVGNRQFRVGPESDAYDVIDLDGVTTAQGVAEAIADQMSGSSPIRVRLVGNHVSFFNTEGGEVYIAGPSTGTTALTSLGLTAGVYRSVTVEFSSHTKVPFWRANDTVNGSASSRPSGSVWIKTTEFNKGAKWYVSRFNTDTNLFESKTAPVYAGTEASLIGLDPVGGGANIALGTLFVDANFETDGKANFKLMARAYTGTTVATTDAKETDATFASNAGTIIISVSGTGTIARTAPVEIEVSSGDNLEDFVRIVNTKSIPNLRVEWISGTNQVKFTHTLGGEIYIGQTVDTPLTTLNLSVGDRVFDAPTADADYAGGFRISNWQSLYDYSTSHYTTGPSQPSSTPADSTLWYAGYQDQVDIMVHNGTTWVGLQSRYPNAKVIVSASKPSNTGRYIGDIWVDTSNQDEYGHNVKRWNNLAKSWDAIDTTDHTSSYGIIYADARWNTNGLSGTASTIAELAVSNFLDPDAPDPTAYPRDMLLWNTRRSGFNIKKYQKGYINTNETNPREDNEAMTNYYEDRWVSVSGQDLNQVAYFGRKAQRAYVVGQLKATLNSNQRILDEDNIFFNLIACPGYPELISDMVNLNNSRNGTALVVGDTPMRLESSANSIVNYGTDYYNSGIDGELGLHTNSDHLAVYYPSGLTTDLSGANVVVPPSYMMLRTIAISDQRSFQWFAPAGTRRGGVTNASSVGYIKDGSYIPVSLNQGTRDQMAQVKINPITNIPGAGLVAFGQYTKTGVNSSLDRINVARLVSYLRRQLGIITKPFLFEPNDKQTRSEIKNVCESLMLDLVSLRGIYDFIVVCDETNNTSSVISNNQLYVDIAIEPVKAVEFIYIPLRLKNVGDIKSRQ